MGLTKVTYSMIEGAAINVLDYGADPTGATDSATAIQAAINAGTTIYLPSGTYKLATKLSITSEKNIIGDKAKLLANTSHITAIEITSSNVVINGLEIEGAGNTSFNTNGKHIVINGTDGGTSTPPIRISNITIKNCYLHDAGRSGVFASFVDFLEISYNKIQQNGYAGVELQSCNDFNVSNNFISDITPGAGAGLNAYGVYVSQQNKADTVRYPMCERGVVNNNQLKNIDWEGIDCHGGRELMFSSNILDNCGNRNAAIAIIHGDDETDTPVFGAKNISVVGNVIRSANHYGIATSVSAVGFEHENISIVGNAIENCGNKDSSSPIGAIRLGRVIGSTVAGNTISYAAPYGVIIDNEGASNISITGNTFKRIVSNDNSQPSAIWINRGITGTGPITISDNTLVRETSAETYQAVNGLRVEYTDGGNLRVGVNHFDTATTKYTVTATQVNLSSSPVMNFNFATIPVTTSISTATLDVTLPNKHSANTVYIPFANLADATSGIERTIVKAERLSTTQIRLSVYTANGSNFSTNGNIIVAWSTNGF